MNSGGLIEAGAHAALSLTVLHVGARWFPPVNSGGLIEADVPDADVSANSGGLIETGVIRLERAPA